MVRLRDVARRVEFGPTVYVAIRDLIRPARRERPARPVPGNGGRDERRRFTRPELEWMIERAGGQCECPGCRLHDDRCLALLDAPGVQPEGDHLVSWDEGGATDPTLNGAALCGPCNRGKGNREFTAAQLRAIATARRVVAQRRR